MMDLACDLQVDEGAHRFLDRHAVIDGVQLVELDAIEPQPLEALLADATQVLGSAVDGPARRTGTHEPTFARNHQPRRVRMQGLGDQCLADPGPVGIGSVDKADALVDRTTKQRDRFVLVARRPPDAGTGDTHSPQAETMDGRAVFEGQR